MWQRLTWGGAHRGTIANAVAVQDGYVGETPFLVGFGPKSNRTLSSALTGFVRGAVPEEEEIERGFLQNILRESLSVGGLVLLTPGCERDPLLFLGLELDRYTSTVFCIDRL